MTLALTNSPENQQSQHQPTTYLLTACAAQWGWNPEGHKHIATGKLGWPIGKEGRLCPKLSSKWGQEGKFPGQLGECIHKATGTLAQKTAVEIIIAFNDVCPRAGHKMLMFV